MPHRIETTCLSNNRATFMARIYVNPVLRYLAARSAFVDRALRRVETGSIDWLWTLTANRPIERASIWGGRVGVLVGQNSRKNKHVLRNLEVIFPDKPPRQIKALARDVWRQIGQTLAEYPHMELLSDPDCGRFDFVCHIPIAKLREANTGFVFVGMHQANWNLHGMAGSLGRFPLDLVYAEQKDPHLERRIAEHRNRVDAGFIHVGDVPRKMIDHLKRGRHVGLFVDHRIDNGEPIAFFGRPAKTTIIPARVAVKLKTGLVPVQLERLENCRFRLTLHEPIMANPLISNERAAAIDMMSRLHGLFEQWVLARPQDWCCVKRRWDKAPSKTEQIGLFGRHIEWRGVK